MNKRKRKINILGTEYTIEFINYEDDEILKEDSIVGYCSYDDKRIVVCNTNTLSPYKHASDIACLNAEKECLRHEIFHAFLKESGICNNSLIFENGWATNEEMIDWFAIQSPKIFKIFTQLNIL